MKKLQLLIFLQTVAIAVMLAHKIESWMTEEWTVSPFFLRAVDASSALDGSSDAVLGEVIFLVFVTWLFVGSALTRAFRQRRVNRAINVASAVLLLASVALALLF